MQEITHLVQTGLTQEPEREFLPKKSLSKQEFLSKFISVYNKLFNTEMELNSDGKLMLNGFYEFWHNRTHRIVICGNAGLGKTTFCKTFIELWRIFSVYFYYEYMKDENNENVLVKYDTTIITEIKAVELSKQVS